MKQGQPCRTHYATNLMAITPKSPWPWARTLLHSVFDQRCLISCRPIRSDHRRAQRGGACRSLVSRRRARRYQECCRVVALRRAHLVLARRVRKEAVAAAGYRSTAPCLWGCSAGMETVQGVRRGRRHRQALSRRSTSLSLLRSVRIAHTSAYPDHGSRFGGAHGWWSPAATTFLTTNYVSGRAPSITGVAF